MMRRNFQGCYSVQHYFVQRGTTECPPTLRPWKLESDVGIEGTSCTLNTRLNLPDTRM